MRMVTCYLNKNVLILFKLYPCLLKINIIWRPGKIRNHPLKFPTISAKIRKSSLEISVNIWETCKSSLEISEVGQCLCYLLCFQRLKCYPVIGNIERWFKSLYLYVHSPSHYSPGNYDIEVPRNCRQDAKPAIFVVGLSGQNVLPTQNLV